MKSSIILSAMIWHTVYSFTCTSQGSFPNPDDSTCQSYIYCVQLPSGIYLSNVYSCTAENFFNPDMMNCDQNYICRTVEEETTQITTPSVQDEFICNAQGRFPNSTDTTCSTYYFCYYLTSGQYYIQNFSCPQGSRFDPESQTCSTMYECGQNTSPSTVDDVTTISTNFECSAQGRFPIEDDVTCSTYYFCYYITSGRYNKQNYSCPQGSRFDPFSQTCSTIYECGKNTAVDDVTTVSPSFECTAQGRFAVETDVTCSSYYFCYYLTNGRYLIYNYTCPSNSRFDPMLQTCSVTYDCTTTSSISTTSLISSSLDTRSGIASNSRCKKQGRFPVESDATCRSYYSCYYTINGSYIENNYLCPNGSRFDERFQTCSTTYLCPQTRINALLTTTSSSFEISTEETTTKLPFECINQGRFSVKDDDTCKLYYYCILLANRTYIHEKYKCPSTTKFDPKLQLCSETFQCIPPTEVSINTNFPLKMIENEVESSYDTFQCVSSGKFPEINSIFCQNYIYCISLPNGDFAQQVYSCADGEKFDPELQKCSQSYQCSFIIKSVNKIPSDYICKKEGKFLVKEDPTCRTYHYCVSLPNEEFGHQLYSCSSGERFDPKEKTCSMSYQCPYFRCSTEGKFLAKEDSTCQTYHYCISLSNGLFGQQLYNCAAGEKFDPNLQICSQNYQCLPQLRK